MGEGRAIYLRIPSQRGQGTTPECSLEGRRGLRPAARSQKLGGSRLGNGEAGKHVGRSTTAYLNRTYAASGRLNGSHPLGLGDCSSVIIGPLGPVSSSGPWTSLANLGSFLGLMNIHGKLFMDHTGVFTAYCGKKVQQLMAKNPERC